MLYYEHKGIYWFKKMFVTSLPPIKGKTQPRCERYPGEESMPPCQTKNEYDPNSVEVKSLMHTKA